MALLMATIGIGLPAYNQIAVQREEERFFQLLKNDIYFAQTEAYRSGLSVSGMFREVGRYDLVQKKFSPMSSREFPDSVFRAEDKQFKFNRLLVKRLGDRFRHFTVFDEHRRKNDRSPSW